MNNMKLDLSQQMMAVVFKGLQPLSIAEAFETVTEINRQGYQQMDAQQKLVEDSTEKGIQNRIDKAVEDALEKAGVKPDVKPLIKEREILETELSRIKAKIKVKNSEIENAQSEDSDQESTDNSGDTPFKTDMKYNVNQNNINGDNVKHVEKVNVNV